ncbi:unnamed protein product [Discula destructiva]
MSVSEPPSSPMGGDMSLEDQVAWYKSQYEQLETELAEFRVSSQELEHELEKDLEAAEKREKSLRDKAESLTYEVDEWKRKYKESRTETNAAQNTLEKEITTLRDTNRTLQHKLRDIEVVNDDFERQARHTNSSLEDLENKYNSAIERGVMMEEEIRIGEQEREQLRIDAQRLREELSDLKIEAEILQDKLKKQDRHMSATLTDLSVPGSPLFDVSAMFDASSPLVTTPPEVASSVSSVKTPVNEPPSPPMSDASAPPPLPKIKVPPIKTPLPPTSKPKRSRLPSVDNGNNTTPRPRLLSSASSRPPTRPAANPALRTTPAARSNAPKPLPNRGPTKGVTPSTSLSHIRSLTAKMQKLEARVQSARSRLPAPNPTPPRASPRGSVLGSSNVAIRGRKRGVGSVSSVSTTTTAPDDSAPTGYALNRSLTGKPPSRLSSSGVSRLSFGPGPLPNRGRNGSVSDKSRPSSRGSTSSFAPSFARPMSRADGYHDSMIAPPRPGSRAGGAYTPLGRPISRASFGNSLHGYSMSVSTAEEDEPPEREYLTPSRRGTYSLYSGGTGIPTPSGLPIPGSRRQSAAGVADTQIRRPSVSSSVATDLGRRPSIAPKLRKQPSTQFGDLGETY